MRNKIMTLDLEGDGLNKDINQRIFPNGCHLDPNTRIWCCTFTCPMKLGGRSSRTMVCKLPSIPRAVYDDNGNYVADTKAIHEESTYIPKKIWANGVQHSIIAYEDYRAFITDIYHIINLIASDECLIVTKGYGKYNYDKLLLEIVFKKEGLTIPSWWNKIWCNAGNEPLINTLWKETPTQVHTGEYIPNQKYMNMGIQHNIVDSEQLFDVVCKVIQIREREEQIKGDF